MACAGFDIPVRFALRSCSPLVEPWCVTSNNGQPNSDGEIRWFPGCGAALLFLLVYLVLQILLSALDPHLPVLLAIFAAAVISVSIAGIVAATIWVLRGHDL